MILFVFEGKKSEPKLFEALKKLFFPQRAEQFVCTYNSNIYSLYSHLVQLDVFKDENIESSGRTLSILNTILQKKGEIHSQISLKQKFLRYFCFLTMIFTSLDCR